MVKLDTFTIHLSRDNEAYFPGEEVSGYLLIKSRERQKINGVVLEFKGETYVHWTQGSNNNRRTYTDRDILFQVKEYVLQKQPNSNDLYLDEFEQNFPFRFTLPSNLATSYEYTPYAHIRYFVRATVEVPWSFNFNKHAVRVFSVVNPLDLNLLPGLRQSFGLNDSKNLCCGPCKSDPIIIDFNTNKTGYVSGESIIFNASIDNRTSKSIKSISVVLIQHNEFIARGSKRFPTSNICSLEYNGPRIGPRMQETWSNGTLKIPIVCPSLLDTCRIIKLYYTLTLCVNFSGLSMSNRFDIPIVIGTIPLYDSNLSLPDTSNVGYYKSGSKNIGEYNESEGYSEQNEKDLRNNEGNFVSKYPYYKDYHFDKLYTN